MMTAVVTKTEIAAATPSNCKALYLKMRVLNARITSEHGRKWNKKKNKITKLIKKTAKKQNHLGVTRHMDHNVK